MSVLQTIVLTALAIFVAPLLGAGFGYFSGWLVGGFFVETTANMFAFLNINDVNLMEIGTALGFVGGFFKS